MNASIPTPTKSRRSEPPDKARRGEIASVLLTSMAVTVLVALVLWQSLGLIATIVEKKELTQTGIQATATITKHHSKVIPSDRGTTEKFLIDYTFTPPKHAEEHASNVALPRELWDTVEVGSTVLVTYKPEERSDNQPTMMLKRLLPTDAGVVGIYVSVLVVATCIWLAVWLARVIMSRRRRSRGAGPRSSTVELDGSKKRSAKDAASKAPMPEKLRGLLDSVVIILALLMALALGFCVLVFGLEFVGTRVVEAIQNFLL
ncbi:DUF3592 domain-containing protein [Paeniglutamicibacter gangotriensis]|uniref:DUF3592 domain-containing protein n=1 Tax=Paeniglutamicibacter gangotriensis Lz1y TaxID=1276920 RepID=M7MQ38_9MICC|nr:DUF3592 domain-containing protein [Paeniglutamicibacter gangotriensis]EMQ98492.1 hypothetical protein ADIAG_01920 [Paeniglutamicibacter gangotriensis Lz1y]